VAAARARRALAALALALAAPCALAVELGTLFNTPEERARLDRLRRGEPDIPAASGETRTLNPILTGFVKRSDGRNTVWIDGAPVPVSRPGSGQLLDPRAVGSDERSLERTLKIERKTPR
jgi:hypothetical protein